MSVLEQSLAVSAFAFFGTAVAPVLGETFSDGIFHRDSGRLFGPSSKPQHFIGKRETCNGDGNGTYQMGLDFVVSAGCGLFFGQPDVPANNICSEVDLPFT